MSNFSWISRTPRPVKRVENETMGAGPVESYKMSKEEIDSVFNKARKPDEKRPVGVPGGYNPNKGRP